MKNFEQYRRGYENLWANSHISPERRGTVLEVARRLNANKAKYEQAVTGTMPWWWIAITNNLENGGRFIRHFSNGDPLTARTTHVPRGRPLKGNPPFQWQETVIDALISHGLDKVTSWTIAYCLFAWEAWNGWGYLGKCNSPYNWSMTDLYTRGKYVSDGRYDPNAISQQAGAAAVLKAMFELGIVSARPTAEVMKRIEVVPTKPVDRVPEWDIVGIIFSLIEKGIRAWIDSHSTSASSR